MPSDDQLWEIYTQGLTFLASKGYQRYEISAFSKAGKQSKHNLNYWLFGDYIGIGAGAHGKSTENGFIQRSSKTRAPKDYLNEQKVKLVTIESSEINLEFLMNALRLNQGFSLSLFQERTGLNPEVLNSFLELASGRKLIKQQDGHIRPSPLGLQYLNEMLMLV